MQRKRSGNDARWKVQQITTVDIHMFVFLCLQFAGLATEDLETIRQRSTTAVVDCFANATTSVLAKHVVFATFFPCRFGNTSAMTLSSVVNEFALQSHVEVNRVTLSVKKYTLKSTLVPFTT